MALPRGLLLAAALSLLILAAADAGTVGVNWGRVANNLPSPPAVVQLLKQHGIAHVKLYDTEPAVLRALANSGIGVVVALPNEQVAAAAARPAYALAWVRRNVAAYYPATQIQGVAVGNEVFATAPNVTSSLVAAMANVHAALARLNMDKAVKVSSPIALTALAASYPPSAGVFREELSQAVMKPMLEFLAKTGSYLMVNAYPFFAYADNAGVISLDYALFRPNAGELDSGSGLKYYSLLDAQLDAVFSAVAKLGGNSYNGVKVVVSETGWPSPRATPRRSARWPPTPRRTTGTSCGACCPGTPPPRAARMRMSTSTSSRSSTRTRSLGRRPSATTACSTPTSSRSTTSSSSSAAAPARTTAAGSGGRTTAGTAMLPRLRAGEAG